MTKTFIQTKEFSINWDRLGLDDDDLRHLELDLLKNSEKYPVMRGTGGLRKARYAIRNQGKSGGIRICYVDFVIRETMYLITVYSKSEKDNLTKVERNDIRKMIRLLDNYLE